MTLERYAEFKDQKGIITAEVKCNNCKVTTDPYFIELPINEYELVKTRTDLCQRCNKQIKF